MKIILFILIFLINFVSFSFQNEIYWKQTEILITNDGKQFDDFGSSVSISNDGKYCVIGAYYAQIGNNYNQGKAYIFQNNGTYWNQIQILIANDGETEDEFGFSISISNDGKYILISSPFAQIGNNFNQGKAYIFQNNGTFWNEIQILIANDGGEGDRFGSSVSISNDGKYCVIGSQFGEVENKTQGKVYIFQNDGTIWNQSQILIASDGEDYDQFGSSLAISNDSSFVVIGAFFANVIPNYQQGKAYIFQNDGTFWNQYQILIANDGQPSDRFGSSISISNDSSLILIGAFNGNVGNNYQQGKAYIFQNNGTNWNQKQILIANDGESTDEFGSSVSISGNYSLIGSPQAYVGTNYNQGKVYIFQNNGTFWNQIQILISSDGEATDNFGTSVSISGNYSLIGSPHSNVSNNYSQGKAYFFDLYSNPNPSSHSKSKSDSKIIFSVIIILIILIGIISIILLIKAVARKRNQIKYENQYYKEEEEILMDDSLFSGNDNEDEDEF